MSKLTTLLTAPRMVVGMVPEVGASEDEQQIVIRAKIVETKVQCLMKTIRKEVQTLRAQKRDLYNGNPKDRETVLAFLADDRIFSIVETYLSKEEMTDHDRLCQNDCRGKKARWGVGPGGGSPV